MDIPNATVWHDGDTLSWAVHHSHHLLLSTSLSPPPSIPHQTLLILFFLICQKKTPPHSQHLKGGSSQGRVHLPSTHLALLSLFFFFFFFPTTSQEGNSKIPQIVGNAELSHSVGVEGRGATRSITVAAVVVESCI